MAAAVTRYIIGATDPVAALGVMVYGVFFVVYAESLVYTIAAALLAAVLMGEPLGWSLVPGIAAVAAGIWIASTGS